MLSIEEQIERLVDVAMDQLDRDPAEPEPPATEPPESLRSARWAGVAGADLEADWEREDAGHPDLLRTAPVTLVAQQSTPEPSRGRGWLVFIAAAAAVFVVLAFVAMRNDDATPADQPSPTVTVPSTEWPEAWSPELTARPLEFPISCSQPGCHELVVSPDGTLVVAPDGTLVEYDAQAATLTWHEDQPRIVPITAELSGVRIADPWYFESDPILVAIGPHDVAYFQSWRPETVARAEPPVAFEFVAVAPSGAEISRAAAPRAIFVSSLMPTAQGLVAMRCTFVENRCTGGSEWPSPDAAVAIPWVDLTGDQVTDARPYPTAKGTDTGIEVRFGEREWLVAGEPWSGHQMPQVVPRSDGGVVLLHDLTFDAPGQPIELFELLPDGTVERYVVPSTTVVLPDGSVIVLDRNGQLTRLAPPA